MSQWNPNQAPAWGAPPAAPTPQAPPQGFGPPPAPVAPPPPAWGQPTAHPDSPAWTAPQAPPQGNPFAGASEARVSDRLPPVGVGNHVLRVDRCLLFTTREGQLLAIAEFVVMQSNNPAMVPGSKCSFVVGLTGKHRETMLGKVKLFVAAVCGVTDTHDASQMSQVTDNTIAQIYGSTNPAAGRVVSCTATQQQSKTTRNAQTGAPNVYTAHQWAPAQ